MGHIMGHIMGLATRHVCLLGMMLLLWNISTPLLAAPALSATLSPDWVQANQPFVLKLEATWTGNAQRYVLYPPTLTLAEGVERGSLKQHFLQDGDQVRTVYEISLRSPHAGLLPLGKLELKYRGTNETDPDEASGTVEMELPTIDVRPGGFSSFVGPLLALLVLSGLGIVLWRRRRIRSPAPHPAGPRRPDLAELLSTARCRFLAGRTDEVYATLLELKPLLPPGQDPLPSSEWLEQERLRARYGGSASGGPELDRFLHACERVLKGTAADDLAQ